MDIGEGHYPLILKCEIWVCSHLVNEAGRIESKVSERRNGDGPGIRDAIAFGSNAHGDQCFKYEHV